MSRLLIVDDNDSVLFAMRGYFDSLGYSVQCARTESDARDHLMAEPYDAVVSDLSLTPGNSEGLEVVKWARERCPAARIFVLTAYGTVENEAEARRLGVDAFLRKPVRLSDLHKLLEDPGHQASSS